jgi:hypothetical protein
VPTHDNLTDEYLATLTDGGLSASTVTETVHSSVVDSSYLGRALTRPVFLGAQEYRQVTDDVNQLYRAITALPDRLFAGDLAGFARAVGMNEAQVSAVMRTRGDGPTRLARADLQLADDGFRMLEMNLGSTMGGLDNALLNQGMLSQPQIEAFVTGHGLTYVDTLAETAAAILNECKVPTGTRPVMAAADWPDSFVTLEPQLRRSAAMLAPLGIDAYACHVGQLRHENGRIWLDDRAVDVVYRLFTLEDLLSDEGPALCEPVIRATERGDVKMFTALDVRVYGSKGALAMLSDEANRHLLTEAERTSIDRILPWTRMLRRGPVTVGEQRVDLEPYVLANREELILKPTLMYSGIGVVPGWLTEPDQWREQIEAALDGPYLVQRRIHPHAEWFPAPDGLEPWILVWGAYLMSEGRGGFWVRGTSGTVTKVANMAQGATATCCFHEPA